MMFRDSNWLATSDWTEKGGKKNTLATLQKTRAFGNCENDVTWELDRMDYHNSWCRSMGTAFVLFEVDYEELFKVNFQPIEKLGFYLKLGRVWEPMDASIL